MFCLLYLPELNKRQQLYDLDGYHQLLQGTILQVVSSNQNAAIYSPITKPFVFSI